jgi:uncharacterized protein (TIGR00369 family)
MHHLVARRECSIRIAGDGTLAAIAMALTAQDVDRFVAEHYPASFAEGYRCEDVGEGFALARWRYDASTLRPGGLISGPTQFAVADCALWYLSFTVVGLEPMAVTSNLDIVFLRPAAGADLLARATLLRAGRSRIVGRVDVWVDGAEERPVAHATGAYAVLAPR